MYEDNYAKKIDNEYYVPKNFMPTYENPYSTRFVNNMPNDYYEENYNKRINQSNCNNCSDNYVNYDNIQKFDVNSFMKNNNIYNYEDGIELEGNFIELYPEIYKKLEPIIEKVINEGKVKKINRGVIDLLTLQIYDEVENNETRKVNSVVYSSNNNVVSKTNNSINSSNNRINNINKITPSANTNKNEKVVDVATKYRNTKNPTLRDLIRILLLNKLFRENNIQRPKRTYSSYNPITFQTNNYNRYEDYNVIPEIEYTRNYFNSPYPEEN